MDRPVGRCDRAAMPTIDRPAVADPVLEPAVRQADLVRTGALTARRLVELHLERIDRLDARLGAYRTVRRAAALEEADLADARVRAGDRAPLLGVPVAIKDN